MRSTEEKLDLVDKVIKYEDNKLSSFEVVIMFSLLKKAGIVYDKRAMESLVDTGWLNKEGNINVNKMKLLKPAYRQTGSKK